MNRDKWDIRYHGNHVWTWTLFNRTTRHGEWIVQVDGGTVTVERWDHVNYRVTEVATVVVDSEWGTEEDVLRLVTLCELGKEE